MESFTIEESREIQKIRVVVVSFGSSGNHVIDTMNFKENNGIEFIRGDEDTDHIKNRLQGADIVFITGGLGGQTGHIVAPLIAKIAKNADALTIGIVTKPFNFEGKQRLKLAEETLKELKNVSDSIVVIPNDKFLSIINPKMGIAEYLKIVDSFLARTINGIAGVILPSGDNDINLDFVDLKSIMEHQGVALVGIGESQGEKASYEAINNAIEFANVDGIPIKNAARILVHFRMHPEFYFIKLSEALDVIHGSVDMSTDIIFGTTTDDTLPIDYIRVTLVSTGFEKRTTIAANNLQ